MEKFSLYNIYKYRFHRYEFCKEHDLFLLKQSEEKTPQVTAIKLDLANLNVKIEILNHKIKEQDIIKDHKKRIVELQKLIEEKIIE